jgi:hypothetical protein
MGGSVGKWMVHLPITTNQSTQQKVRWFHEH